MVFMYVNVLANKNTSLNICVFANMWIYEGALERMHAFDPMNDIINKPTQENKNPFSVVGPYMRRTHACTFHL